VSREFDAIVIGSGLGGLASGAVYASEGHRVLVLERNASFGGAAGTFQLGPLTVEASLHELDGLDDEDTKRDLFERLRLRETVDFVDVGALYEVRSAQLGEPFVLPHGLDAARAAVAERFPAHARASERWFELNDRIRRSLGVAVAKQDDKLWWVRNAPRLPFLFFPYLRHARSSTGGVMRSIFGDNDAIKMAVAANIQYYGDDPDRLWFPFFAAGQGSYYRGGGHYVHGGSSRLVDALLDLIRAAGGEAENGRLVTGIDLANGRVSGVQHRANEDGVDANVRTDRAPVVFGNAAPHVLAEMLPGEIARTFRRRYEGRPVSLTLWTLALGFDRPPSDFGVRSYSTWIFPEWLTSLDDLRMSTGLLGADPGSRTPHFVFADYSQFDSGLAQPPYFASVGGLDEVGNWESLTHSESRDRRARWTDRIVAALDEEFPGIGGAVTQTQLMTAQSNRSYLNTPGGAIYGFAPEPPRLSFFKPKTPVPGLLLASAYGGIGGYTGAMLSGAAAARAALRSRG
jgi:phytoene dehydrogenase-like protein